MSSGSGDLAAVFVGQVIMFLFFLTEWHQQESLCQQEHNVSDCVRVFVPAPEEEIAQ